MHTKILVEIRVNIDRRMGKILGRTKTWTIVIHKCNYSHNTCKRFIELTLGSISAALSDPVGAGG